MLKESTSTSKRLAVDRANSASDDLLIQSRRRDPMFKGTQADPAKAEWFADLWKQAVAGRDREQIHVRGVDYYIVMSTGEDESLNFDQLPVEYDPDELSRLDGPVRPPTDCSWTEYANTDKCYDYLEGAAAGGLWIAAATPSTVSSGHRLATDRSYRHPNSIRGPTPRWTSVSPRNCVVGGRPFSPR